MRVTPASPQLPHMLHVVILGIIVENAIISRFALVMAHRLGPDFMLEIGQILRSLGA